MQSAFDRCGAQLVTAEKSAAKQSSPSQTWTGRVSDPRLVAIMLLITFCSTLAWQYFSDHWSNFESGVRGVRENDGRAVQAALKSLAGDERYRLQLELFNAYISLRDGDFQDAIKRAEQAKQHPDVSVEANVLAGEAAYVMGAPGNAKLYWEEALRQDSNYLPAHRWMGVLYYDLGAMDLSIMHLSIVSKLAPKDARPDRLMGLMNRDYERPEVAIPHYVESLKRSPNQPDADQVRFELAECHYKLREYDKSLEVLKLCQESPKHQLLKARCLLNTGALDESRQLAGSVLSLESKPTVDTLQLNAEIALADGNPKRSEELLQTATQVDPYHHGVRTQLAQVLARLQKMDESQKQTEVAEELQKKWQRFSDLQIDAINQPTNAEIRFEIGSLANQLGKLELARVWYKAALAINPSMQSALKALAALDSPPKAAAP